LQRYGDLTVFFQNGGRPPSWICWARIRTNHADRLVVSIRAVKKPVLNRRTKFRKDRSNGWGDIAVFVIFKMAANILHDWL